MATTQQGPPQHDDQALEKAAPKPKLQELEELFKAHSHRISEAANRVLDVRQMLAVALSTVSRNQKLLKCTTPSLVMSIMDAAKLGLQVNPLTQEGHLVPFKNGKTGQHECQFMIGYKGLIKLAKRSGDITNVAVEVVYDSDTFSYSYGLNPDLEHIPAEFRERGEPIGVYAILWFKSGRPQFKYMTIAECLEHGQKFSKSRKGKELFGPWKDHQLAMCMKTVLRVAMKYAILGDSEEQSWASMAVHQDELAESNIDLDRLPIAEPQALEEHAEDPEPQAEPKIDPGAAKNGRVGKTWVLQMEALTKKIGLTPEDVMQACEQFEFNSLAEVTVDKAEAVQDFIERLA